MSHNLPQLVTPPAAAAAVASSSAAAAAGGQKPTSSFRRKILTQDDMAQWTQSEAYTNIERFIIRLRDASTCPVSDSEVSSHTFYVFSARRNADVAALASDSSSSGSMHS